MSETTSTNISVAQANSTDSLQASSRRYSRMTDPGSTKKICFYKSGDPRFSGIKMVVSNRSFKTFDALLDNLSKKVPLPFGVRNITTPRGIHHITNLEELEDGKSYICSHQRKIKPINLERASKKPLLWQSSRPISARRRALQLARQNEVSPFQRENTVVLGSSKNFVILKNGDKESKHNLVLNKKSIQNFDVFLDQISEVMQFHVYKLYSTDGRRILSTNALLLSSGTIIAAGREPFKPGNYESEREFLPAKLPGISHRVFPKSRSKPEMKSQVKTNESLYTSPNGQEPIYDSANVSTTDHNTVDYSHVGNNEIHLTQQWPQSGEELPVISPGDHIEKTVHLNSDGTMTVEMKVRFKIREDETINWSTTVSRAELLKNTKRLFFSSIKPEVQTLKVIDSPVRTSSLNCKPNEEGVNTMEVKQHSHIEKLTNQIQDDDININKYRPSSTRTEKSTFYRPPTPGIRKGQERKLSVRRASEVTLQETMKQMFSFKETDHETIQCGRDTDDQCNKHDKVPDSGNADAKSNETSSYHKTLDQLNEENFEVLETTHMELLHKNTVYEKGGRKCERSNYMSFSGKSTIDRPYSAGKQKLNQEQFKFREIKRSMSASVTVSEKSTLPGETNQTNMEFTHGECLEMVRHENEAAQMMDVPSGNFLEDVPKTTDYISPICREKVEKGSENDTGVSNDNYSTTSSTGPKKKKKKNLNNTKKHVQTNIPKDDKICPGSPNRGTSCREAKPTAKNIIFEEIFPPHTHPLSNECELNTTRKVKGNKQMAKVKPRSLKTNDDLVYDHTQNEDYREIKNCNAVELISKCTSDCSSTIILNETEEVSLTESKPMQEELMPKRRARGKRSLKTSKKQKSSKKKSKTGTENKATNASDGLESETNNSHTLQNELESYVQSWLKNIFPNVAFPVLQPVLTTKLEENIVNSTTNSNNGLCMEPYVDINNHIVDEACGNPNGCQNKTGLEENDVGCTGSTGEKEVHVQQVQPFDDNIVSLFMERSKHLAELFAQQYNDFGCNSITGCGQVMMDLSGQRQEPPKKPSIDAAVQVENDNSESLKCGLMGDMLAEKFGVDPINIAASKCRRLEKSFSLPNSPSRPESSSPQILLAWLIVLHLKQSMSHIIENISGSNNSSAILTLLQSLKKIAITERADDLKAVVLNLQESALRSNSAGTSKNSIQEFPVIQQNCTGKTTECNTESNQNIPSIKETYETSNVLNSEIHDDDDTEDFRFFATQPYRQLSSEFSQNENDQNVEEHCLSEYQHSLQKAASDLLEKVEHLPNNRQDFEEHISDLSPEHMPSLLSNCNADHTDGAQPVSPKKISRVKMMVQEMEQKKYSSQYCEQQKCLQSPISSDWSDYRQDSEESVSDNLRASSEIMTESGEEQIHEKPLKTGYVRRAIERLYGKAESMIMNSKSPNNKVHCKNCPLNENNEYLAFSSQDQQCLSKESISRSISSPSNKSIKVGSSGSVKSISLPLLDAAADNIGLICQKPGSSQSKSHRHKVDTQACSHSEPSTSNGVLIDKGRWLLKENHLLRRSPPEATGMYVNLDTTSGDTLLDNTSDDVPYMHPACKVNQPLAEISSSELEDMAKPHQYTCNYFNMPHGSDSEPFKDTLSARSHIRPKSSGGLVKSKTHDAVSLESMDKCGGISASLPSFATVDFHMSDNKVYPLPHDSEKARTDRDPNAASRNRGEVREQDSLDKLQFICGQHCPILSAIILPVNEGDRGFAYSRPSDIENLLFLPSVSMSTLSIDNALLNNCAIIDENNNIQYSKVKDPAHNCCDTQSVHFDDVHHTELKRVKTFISLKKKRDCLSELFPNTANTVGRIINRYKDIHIRNLFQEFMCVTNDENNNILYYKRPKSMLTLC
ncbi:hypothetical protein GDO81_011438 [Engystomops pustulosus]|uniref:Doublecortin domain-containing protein n=1 Tax=Engystomops pustulosus TaxID=76066 RepID=A0AAV7BEA4_ENGPU|nr:hypothetical protein GDO81_011438 [Engystomops pustulosus]